MTLSFAVLLLFLAIVGFFTWLHYSVQHDNAKSLKTLAALSCHHCGAKFGETAALLARDNFFARCKKLQAEQPEYRINHARYWPVTCLSCGTEASYHYQKNTLSHADNLVADSS